MDSRRGWLCVAGGLAFIAGWLARGLTIGHVRDESQFDLPPLETTLAELAGEDVVVFPVEGKYGTDVQHRYLQFVWPGMPRDQAFVEARMLALYRAAAADIETVSPSARYKRITIWLDDDPAKIGSGQQVCVMCSTASAAPAIPSFPDEVTWKWPTDAAE